jgi:putative hydrolase of the HAD superfamily
MIKNLIFDLGNVIIDLNEEKARKSLSSLGENVSRKAYAISENKPAFFDEFERGEISPAEFRVHFKKYLNVEINNEQLDDVWNALLGDFPLSRLDFLTDLLSQGIYKTFLLSNTNDIHIPAVEEILAKNTNDVFTSLTSFFHKVYYSQNMGLRKPDQKIYEMLLKENNLKAEETAFFDDNKANIESSSAMNILSYLVVPKEKEILDFFEKDENGIWKIII